MELIGSLHSNGLQSNQIGPVDKGKYVTNPNLTSNKIISREHFPKIEPVWRLYVFLRLIIC